MQCSRVVIVAMAVAIQAISGKIARKISGKINDPRGKTRIAAIHAIDRSAHRPMLTPLIEYQPVPRLNRNHGGGIGRTSRPQTPTVRRGPHRRTETR